MNPSVATRLGNVRRQLAESLADVGRAPDSAHLIAVSKTHPADGIREALAHGQLDFGESYAQELRDKAPELPETVRWHFIGRLQKNKAKYVAPRAYRVHGLTHVDQAEALAKRAPGPLKVLINVNVGGESSKAGIAPDALDALSDGVAAVQGIELVGLMCIPPFTEDPNEAAPSFARLAALFERQKRRGHPLTELSMGMTRDFPIAVAHGATWVRVGTAIFGPRP